MIDVTRLRPADNTPTELRAALVRTNLACGECAADIASARQQRDQALLAGTNNASRWPRPG